MKLYQLAFNNDNSDLETIYFRNRRDAMNEASRIATEFDTIVMVRTTFHNRSCRRPCQSGGGIDLT